MYPDFMERRNMPSYESRSVLGELYRESKRALRKFMHERSSYEQALQLDPDLVLPGHETMITHARKLCISYNIQLQKIMHKSEVRQEADLLSGCFGHMYRHSSRDRRKNAQQRQLVNLEVCELRENYYSIFYEDLSPEHANERALQVKASAWYVACYQVANEEYERKAKESKDSRDSEGRPVLLSFPWVVTEILSQIKQCKIRIRDRATY
jgi:RNA-dependent RNA polymerase